MIKKINADFYRYTNGSKNPVKVLLQMFHNPGMLFSVLYRIERHFLYESISSMKIFGWILYPLYFFFTYYVLSYHIEPAVNMGKGLFIHNMDIVITDDVKIGKNFSIMGQTTIGTNFDTKGKIIIGDNVSVGAGAKIIASRDLRIADSVTIGANAVVVKSILKKNSVWGGFPVSL
jgi:serine O-acetyltransferase